jgi:hypothetical protein
MSRNGWPVSAPIIGPEDREAFALVIHTREAFDAKVAGIPLMQRFAEMLLSSRLFGGFLSGTK